MLLSVDQHFPPHTCSLYFSYDSADDDARAAVHGTVQHIQLIRRGVSNGWAGSMLQDLARLRQHRWVFHLMDDACIPDPIDRASIEAVLSVAELHNASTVALSPRVMNLWRKSGRLRLAHQVKASTARNMARNLTVTLKFFSPTPRSSMVVQQNFALWRWDSLAWSLNFSGVAASPAVWENGFARRGQLVQWPGLSQALAVHYSSTPGYMADGMAGVEDIGHHGQVKPGWGACAWIRAAGRLQLSPSILPEGGTFSQHEGYRFCHLDGAVGDGALLLRASPKQCGCWMNKTSHPMTVACHC